jgi:DNA-binding GntR family transcriptional regulator
MTKPYKDPAAPENHSGHVALVNAPDGMSALAGVVARLEEDIVLGQLHPRERLIEDDLMQRFGVLRHVARAALAHLVQLGLVEHKKNVGAFVRSFSREQVVDLYDMRELLETEATRRMPCPAPAPATEYLRELQAVHDHAVLAGDARQIFRANMAFHQALFSLCPNQTMVRAVQYYAMQTHAIRFSSAASAMAQNRSRAEHIAMIEALESGNREALVHLCRQHLAPSRDEYLQANRL